VSSLTAVLKANKIWYSERELEPKICCNDLCFDWTEPSVPPSGDVKRLSSIARSGNTWYRSYDNERGLRNSMQSDSCVFRVRNRCNVMICSRALLTRDILTSVNEIDNSLGAR
jgi:hypothetical protein